MIAAALLADLSAAGISVAAMPEGRLRIRGPQAAVNRFRPMIGESKSALLEFLAPAPDAAAIDERAALAAECVPAVYLDVWARIQVVRPVWAGADEWPGLIDAAGRFLDQWGAMAAGFGWTPEDLFGREGLIRAPGGETVRALGPEQATLTDGRTYERKVHGL